MHFLCNPLPPVRVLERAGDQIFTPYLSPKFPIFPCKTLIIVSILLIERQANGTKGREGKRTRNKEYSFYNNIL